MSKSKPRVAYFRHDDLGLFYYGREHPMKPFRLQMTDSLVHSYGLHRRPNVTVYDNPVASFEELTKFHHPDYVKFLEDSDANSLSVGLRRCRLGNEEVSDHLRKCFRAFPTPLCTNVSRTCI